MHMTPTLHPSPRTPALSVHGAATPPAVRCTAVLFDASENGKIMVEGVEAAGMLKQVWPGLLWGGGDSDLAIGSGIEVGSGQVYRLRSDLFFVHTPPAYVAQMLEQLRRHSQASAGLITVTPVTHGRAELRLVSAEAAHPAEGAESRCRTLLSRVCGLDFGAAAFPDLTARMTSLAKTRQLVIRRDQDGQLTFAIIGPRSLGAYVLATLTEAGRDLGIVLESD